MCKPLLQHLDRIEQQDTDERKKNDCSPDIAAMDLFVAPTIGFDLLYVLVIVRLERRKLVWINVTPHPTAEWIARQVTEAFPWSEAPHHLIRDGIGSTALPTGSDRQLHVDHRRCSRWRGLNDDMGRQI